MIEDHLAVGIRAASTSQDHVYLPPLHDNEGTPSNSSSSFAFWVANSASVSTPESRSCASLASSSATEMVGAGAADATGAPSLTVTPSECKIGVTLARNAWKLRWAW